MMSICIYCGEPATTIDHLLPVGWFEGSHRAKQKRNNLRGSVPTVDSCKECNSLLGDKFIPDLSERVQYIGKLLISRKSSDERIAFNARIFYELQKSD